MGLTKEQILLSNDGKPEEVPVPEWGGSVYIKVMSGTAREQLETAAVEKKLTGSVRCNFLVQTLCDETGKLLFDVSEIEALNEKNSRILDELFDKVRLKNKFFCKDLEAKDDELGNDSKPTKADDSTSA